MRTVKALIEVLAPIAKCTTHLESDFYKEDDALSSVPIFHIKPLPGVPSKHVWERIDGIQIDLYAIGPSQANELMRQAEELLQGWAMTSEGLIDKIQAEVPFYEESIPHDTLNKQTSTYLVTYRI
ncbi:hypothetical protein [Glutamicibacter sp. TV12E]|uniref:hypothetical protein n=1 Tax=Glutamicibacter sp. TV12E TaxID=3446362 RepID=UPI004034F4C0